MIDVLIPTLGRPERLPALVANIHAATVAEHRVCLIVEPHELGLTLSYAVMAEGCYVVANDGPPSYAGAINTGARYSHHDWLFVGADDLLFHPGWDRVALELAAAQPHLAVIGTNDRINPHVLAGDHATHYLVRRSHLDTVGGTVDGGPGSFLHEGYVHNFCDTEFVATAQARQVFAPCLASVVEHRHHSVGASARDAVHDRADAAYGTDAALFESRRHLWEAP